VGGDFEAGLCEFCKRVSIDPHFAHEKVENLTLRRSYT